MSNNDFMKMLRDKNLKITAQRVAILDEIYKNGHCSVDDIYALIRDRIPSVSLATVYKNVISMQSAEIIKSVKAPTQKQKYEIRQQPHIHLHCRICDGLEDCKFDLSEFHAYCAEKSGYAGIDDCTIVMSGICPKCQEKRENGEKNDEGSNI